MEIEAVAAWNLVSQMEQGVLAPAPVWTDLKTAPYEDFYGKVEIFTGGYPCQPFSQAGLQGGVDDPRHLFPHIERGVDAVRPVLCWFENVANHLNIGFEEVRWRLSRLGYKVEAGIYSAENVGAPHLRKRLFILCVADTYCTEQSKKRGDLAEVLGFPQGQRQPKYSPAIWKKRTRKDRPIRNQYDGSTYDNKQIPTEEYFDELFRVSVNQIIWGYNYFTDILGPTNYLLIWDKMSASNNFFKYSKCEIAWTSFKIPCDIIRVPWDGSRMGEETGQKKIHPHQRPIKLYKKLLSKYAMAGHRILDTHLGSGSSRIAAYDMGFDFTAFEKDKMHYDDQERRFNTHISQQKLFVV